MEDALKIFKNVSSAISLRLIINGRGCEQVLEYRTNYGSMSISRQPNMLWLNARKDFCMYLAIIITH
jgi:hypothetical protein